ncbi:hypothetical protein GOBAR_AA38539 [Gossypium barbadense]|uniref:Reverse transcriptase zinc-binding domain-containing protein n=1 Tax=Gossypium barbadense TaxID=3634 RepID=A0A2P5QP95_GOSBA|nr:hypothetical protein GOBAR_DD26685 [Gossypium barbadense]PPR82175.1 hypothetical protein GOBAR_AA38539 [Gossypium barbadense]
MEYWGWCEVDFWRDSWVENCEPLMNSSIQPDLAPSNNVPLCNMTDHIGDWNWTQFKHSLTEPIALKISALQPPLQSNIPDFPGWRWERRHVFITKSAYYYAMDNQNSLEPHKHWRCFWSYEGHHRFNFHVSGDQQKLLITLLAIRCAAIVETTDHILRRCFPTIGWDMVFGILSWSLWNEMNSRILNEAFFAWENILERGSRFWNEFIKARSDLHAKLGRVVLGNGRETTSRLV